MIHDHIYPLKHLRIRGFTKSITYWNFSNDSWLYIYPLKHLRIRGLTKSIIYWKFSYDSWLYIPPEASTNQGSYKVNNLLKVQLWFMVIYTPWSTYESGGSQSQSFTESSVMMHDYIYPLKHLQVRGFTKSICWKYNDLLSWISRVAFTKRGVMITMIHTPCKIFRSGGIHFLLKV